MPHECRHVHVMGRRCGSPALSGKLYCYFHARSRTRHNAPTLDATETILHPLRADALGQFPPATVPLALTFDFPTIEDRESIQVSTSMILSALGRNQLDPKRAATMLYALQVATAVTQPDESPHAVYYVETDVITAPDGTDLAPDLHPPSTPETHP